LIDQLLTVGEAAEFLRIHPKTLYRLIAERRIPYIRKPGLGYRFMKAQLLQWLRNDLTMPSEWKDVI
jgi:excisionase family DNA binding protein